MQDRYAGDVGDFSKFALIRQLSRGLDKRVGVIWYRFPDESHNNDGRHIDYLGRDEWVRCDKDLVAKLSWVVASGVRKIIALEESGVLRNDSAFFGEAIHPSSSAGWTRAKWLSRAMERVKDCPIVVVDPDNGIGGPNHSPSSHKGGKHITLAEIELLASRHECLVIYHHFGRSKSHELQMQDLKDTLRRRLPNHGVLGCRYRRYSPRAYLIVTQPGVHAQVAGVLRHLTTDINWKYHFQE